MTHRRRPRREWREAHRRKLPLTITDPDGARRVLVRIPPPDGRTKLIRRLVAAEGWDIRALNAAFASDPDEPLRIPAPFYPADPKE